MTESKKLLDYWLPPEAAGDPITCLATSFTFDPDFFEQQCLGRFLGLNARRDEGDSLEFLIEQEERLAEARACVIVDRSYNPEGRSLRWDLLPLGVKGGLLHAKVAVLVWHDVVRFIVGSANLTVAGYRNQVETAVVLDAKPGSMIQRSVFDDLLGAIGALVERTPGTAASPGPKERALATLDLVGSRISSLSLPERQRDGLWMKVIPVAPGAPALPQLRALAGRPPLRSATVMSPFFETDPDSNLATRALFKELAQRGERRVDFVVPVSSTDVHTVVNAPESILKEVPNGGSVRFLPFEEPPSTAETARKDDERRLHAKVILLESEQWLTAMIGSSNFTSAGLGLNRSRGHLEINLAFCAAADSRYAKQLRQLVSMGDPIDREDVQWDPEPEEAETGTPPLPTGFVDCLLDPREAQLICSFDSSELPKDWEIQTANARTIVDSSSWAAQGSPAALTLKWEEDQFPFFLQVKWEQDGAWSATWPVNVTEPAHLPPPEELRSFPAEALLRALASTRPLMDILPAILRQLQVEDELKGHPDLDPLKRHSTSGLLLQRTRSLSRALSGLKQRLERPAANLDALEWRLSGPFGPTAIAKALLKEEERGLIQGERSFLLAEIALTLSRVDWESTAKLLPLDEVLAQVSKVLRELKALHDPATVDPLLEAYIERAFAAATV